jgi:hypothetical protein
MANLIPRNVPKSVGNLIEAGASFTDTEVNKVIDVLIIVTLKCDECGSAHDFRITSTLDDDTEIVYTMARCLDGMMAE